MPTCPRRRLVLLAFVLALAGGLAPTPASAAAPTADCAALVAEKAAFNASVDQNIAFVNALNIPPDVKTAFVAQLEAQRTRGNAEYDLLLAYAGCTPPPPGGLLTCAQLVAREAEINANFDALVAFVNSQAIAPDVKAAFIQQIEAERARSLAFNDRLLAVAGCVQPPICANPPTPPAGAIIAQPGTVTFGTEGNDVIYGTSGDDRIVALGGDDLVFGLGGNDRISGGPGDDTICGGAGDDLLSGDEGADVVSGDAGNDDLSGGAGDDKLSGGPGTNRLSGGDGSDSCAPFGDAASTTAGCETVISPD